jgi:GNAT superfamily N-acetyltransferase
VASTTNMLLSEGNFQAHRPWEETIGGLLLRRHDPDGSTLYGVDISVHPDWRGKGIGRTLYQARFDLVRDQGLTRYATGCRVPGLRDWICPRALSPAVLEEYLSLVRRNQLSDRTLTPLLKMGVSLVGGQLNYMEDEESLNCAALLEWTP